MTRKIEATTTENVYFVYLTDAEVSKRRANDKLLWSIDAIERIIPEIMERRFGKAEVQTVMNSFRKVNEYGYGIYEVTVYWKKGV